MERRHLLQVDDVGEPASQISEKVGVACFRRTSDFAPPGLRGGDGVEGRLAACDDSREYKYGSRHEGRDGEEEGAGKKAEREHRHAARHNEAGVREGIVQSGEEEALALLRQFGFEIGESLRHWLPSRFGVARAAGGREYVALGGGVVPHLEEAGGE